jgi:hypothetical protein
VRRQRVVKWEQEQEQGWSGGRGEEKQMGEGGREVGRLLGGNENWDWRRMWDLRLWGERGGRGGVMRVWSGEGVGEGDGDRWSAGCGGKIEMESWELGVGTKKGVRS